MTMRLYTNATILTMNPTQPTAEAVLIDNGRISFVGSLAEARHYSRPDCQTIDLAGQTMIPGFNEAHNHMISFGLSLAQIDAGYPATQSITAMMDAYRKQAQAQPNAAWIRGRGYDDNKLAERRHPNRYDLDAAVPDRPAIVTNASGHMSVVNSKALQLAGIGPATADPQGGHIVRDEHGEATGLLQETAQQLVTQHIPEASAADLREAVRRCCEAYAAAGITSSQDASSSSGEEIAAYQDAREHGELLLRTNLMIRDNLLPHLAALGLRGRFGDNRLRIGPIKFFSDGSLIGRTAAVTEPFANDPRTDNLGLEMMPQEELNERVWLAHRAGFQIATHAIGDRAIGMVLDAYESALARLPRADHRHRVEHCGILRPDLIGRLRDHQFLAVSQPIFVSEYGDGFLRHLGEERVRLTYPFSTLLDAGITLVFSSDCPVSAFQPLKGIRDAVCELTGSGEPYVPAEAITVEEALHAYTVAGAFASFEEQDKGQIAPGMLADFAILQNDPRKVDPRTIAEIPVTMTIVGGEPIFGG